MPDNKLVLELDSNKDMSSLVANTALPQVRFEQVDLGNLGCEVANIKILLPPGYREEDKIGFPALVHVSGDPGGQSVSSQWRLDWASYMSSKLGYVVITMDVSGTGYQGDSCRKSVYRRLGSLETKDILNVIRLVLVSRESDCRIANVCPSVCQSFKTSWPLRIMPVS